MSNLKKIFFAVIITILVILGYSSISNAAYRVHEYKSKYGDYHIGQHKTEGYQQYLGKKALFCLEHGQRLRSQIITYTVKSIITLKGNTATGPVQDGTYKNGDIKLVEKSISDWPTERNKDGKITKQGSNNINTKLSYVFSMLDREDKADIQEAVWWYMDSWINKIGKKFYGVNVNTAASKNEGKPELANEAKAYAKKAKDGPKIEKKDTNIKTQIKDEYIEVGPFKWSYEGDLIGSSIKVLDENSNEISNVTFGVYNGNNFKKIKKKDIPSNSKFYIRIPLNNIGIKKITKITGKIEVDDSTVELIFMEPDNVASWQNLMYVNVENEPISKDFSFDYDIPLIGELSIIKVNSDNTNIKLNDIGFKFRNIEINQYVRRDANGNISYTSDINSATEFITGKDGASRNDGKIVINNVLLGNYEVIETTNPHYGYRFEGPNQMVVNKPNNTTPTMIKNKQIYVKLSGYVFLDVQSAKQSYRNNLYRNDTMDNEDQLLNNVQVRLVDRRTGNTVTSDNGVPFTATTKEINLGDSIIRYYQFVDVRIDDLSNYYMEFTYDGLTYQNVTPILTANNGSKSAEDATTRDNFNKSFSTIEGSGNGADTGVALNESGQVAHDLSYSYNGESYISTLINNGLPTGQYPITANTDSAGYNIRGDFEYGDEEVPYINLGLYEREKPDLSLEKDMYNARISVNGYNHIYEYARKTDHESGYDGDGFNVGVKWSSEYISGKYTRAIYKSDIDYINENDKSKELQVYLTYIIDVTNEASGIQTRVNSIADYFDNRYELIGTGTGIDGEGNITGNINYNLDGQNYNEKYKKVVINPNMTIDPGKTGRIYVQFKLNKEVVVGILNDKDLENNSVDLLDNIAEINSYSSFQNGKAYAGVDKDSNPGNITIEGEKVGKHDFDDTDISPALQLEIADARTLEGKVFLDSTSGELMTGEVRQGSGAYEEGETGISGVKVTFTENTGSGKVYETTTDENGDFHIDNYIPGDYTLTYTWGDETYTVQNYKGTIYQSSRDQSNKEWYKEVDTRWTDAIDNYNQDQDAPKGSRQQIDDEMKTITNGTTFTRNQMDSTTPTMGVGVEYEAVYTASAGDRYEYRIHNVDFGIVERARQDISLNKRVKTMKVTLANGRVLVDLTVNEDGSLSGTNSSVMYIPGSQTTEPKQGIVRLEMDSELMSGALLEVGYEFTATNNSELDYLSEKYYKYGMQEGEVVTITPTAIIDYLDTDWGFEVNKNEGWEAINLNDSKIDLAQPVRESTETKNRQMIYTENLATPIKPTESNTTTLNVSKLLTSSQDIELDNETEIIKVNKTGGSDLTTTPGDYVPTSGPQVDRDDDMAERVIITPNTGENLNFILPISIGISAFVIIGLGVIFIKKKVLNK